MVHLLPRLHLFEINDQFWFPQYFRSKIQSCLTLCWTFYVPLLQPSSPAQLVARTLSRELSTNITNYTYVDFCSGAGGPTPYIEIHLNSQLRSSSSSAAPPSNEENTYAAIATAPRTNGVTPHPVMQSTQSSEVKFVLTDLHPHIPDWTAASKKSANLTFVDKPVDAANAPTDLLEGVKGREDKGKKVFRLYNLAFHHFPDALAAEILRNTMDTADGFAIFELQERTISSLITMFGMGILMMIITPFYFWRSPGHLFFTYVIPVIPFVLVFDGLISSLRTRNAKEVEALMKRAGGKDGFGAPGWKLMSGRERHTFPTGYMTWVMGIKEDK
ncbi:Haloacid dehalogenase protein [Rutstroemia sp. NJR-2017a BBW]|nr:Haloacid dehalogenase protein [Rutstroemia sp. NJR-2017a BBW]